MSVSDSNRLVGGLDPRYCPVCGYDPGYPPWGVDGNSPTREVCSCCGVCWSDDIRNPRSRRGYREAWIGEGAEWVDSQTAHDGLATVERLSRLPLWDLIPVSDTPTVADRMPSKERVELFRETNVWLPPREGVDPHATSSEEMVGGLDPRYCPVCGYDPGYFPWGEDGHSAQYEICPCCDTEWGAYDRAPWSRRKLRDDWIAAGANWSWSGEDPDGLTTEERLARLPQWDLVPASETLREFDRLPAQEQVELYREMNFRLSPAGADVDREFGSS